MGGNIYDVNPIKLEDINSTLENYFKELKEIFPNKSELFEIKEGTLELLGSAGKKDYSGDIDLGMEITKFFGKDLETEAEKWGLDKEFVIDKFNKLKKRARTATDDDLKIKALLFGISKILSSFANFEINEKKIGTGELFVSYPQPNGRVQIDWMVGDLKLLAFSYYSKSYPDGIKGLHRTQLLLSMFKAFDYTFSHKKGLKKGDFFTKDPTEIVGILSNLYSFNNPEIVYDYNDLIEIILSQSDEIKYKVLDIYFRILSYTPDTTIPQNIKQYWDELQPIHNYETKWVQL